MPENLDLRNLARSCRHDFEAGLSRLAGNIGEDEQAAREYALATLPIATIPNDRIISSTSRVNMDLANLASEQNRSGALANGNPLRASWDEIRHKRKGIEGLGDIEKALREHGESYAIALLSRHKAVTKEGYSGFGQLLDGVGLTEEYLGNLFGLVKRDIFLAGLSHITHAAEIRHQQFQAFPPLFTLPFMDQVVKRQIKNPIIYNVHPNPRYSTAQASAFAWVFINDTTTDLRIVVTTAKEPEERTLITQRGHQYQALANFNSGRIAEVIGAIGISTLLGRTIGGGDKGEDWYFGSCADASDRLARRIDEIVKGTSDETTQRADLTNVLVNNTLAKDYEPRTGLAWVPSAGIVDFGPKNVPIYSGFVLATQIRAELDRRGTTRLGTVLRTVNARMPR